MMTSRPAKLEGNVGFDAYKAPEVLESEGYHKSDNEPETLFSLFRIR